MQAAAECRLSAFHPIHTAPSVALWLQQQRAVHASLVSRAHTSQHLLRPRGVANQDCTKVADCVASEGSVRMDCVEIHDLHSDALLQLWRLPGTPVYRRPADWHWGPCGERLVLPFVQSQSDALAAHAAIIDEAQGGLLGLVFLNIRTGHSTTVSLHGKAGISFCPQQGLVCVRHVDSAAQSMLSLYDCNGSLRHSTAAPCARVGMTVWNTAGTALALPGHWPEQKAWVWDLASGAVQTVECSDGLRSAWSTPDSQRLYLASPRTGECVLTTSVGPAVHISQPLPLHWSQTNWVAWGSRLAGIIRYTGGEPLCRELLVYRVSAVQLTLQAALSVAHPARLFTDALCLSADGEHCALLTGSVQACQVAESHLAVLHLASCRMREYPLIGFEAVSLLGRSVRLRWTPACTAVLVTALNDQGEHWQQLISLSAPA